MIIDTIIRKIFSILEGRKWKSTYDMFRKKYNISTSFRFVGLGINIYGDGQFFAGENSYMGSNCSIQVGKDNVCKIGNNCRLASNVRIYTVSVNADNNLDVNPFDKSLNSKKTGDVIIGNGVWLGANVFINPGITIGNNVVVGANSVVTKNLVENGIYGGVPAKLIRKKSNSIE